MTPLDRPVPSQAEIVTAFTDGQVTLRRNRTKIGYHEASDLSGYQGVEAGDFVVHGLDILRGSVGVSDSRGAMSSVCTVCQPSPDVDGRYVAYVIRLQAASGYTRALARGIREGGADFRRWDTLAELPVPVPPLSEQRRIADFLDDQVARIDNIIAARREQITLTAAMRASMILDRILMGGDLGGTPESFWYRGLPDGVPIRPLRSAWQVVDCKHRTPEYVDEGIPVVSPGDISPAPLDLARCHRFVDEIDYADLADPLRRCQVGDIVYSRNASAGTAAIVTTDAPFTMGQDVCRITSYRQAQTYLYYVLNFAVTPQLNAARVGSTFTRINIDEIKALRVPVLSEADQDRVARDADDIASGFAQTLLAQRQQVDRLEELKRSVIASAVTGEFDVSAAEGSRVPA